MTKEETFIINVGGFLLACLSFVWMIVHFRYGFSFPLLNELMTLPAWAALMVILSLALSAIGKGKYAIGMLLGAVLSVFVILAVFMSI
jgi:hypothetical protein